MIQSADDKGKEKYSRQLLTNKKSNTVRSPSFYCEEFFMSNKTSKVLRNKSYIHMYIHTYTYMCVFVRYLLGKL